MTTLAPMCAAAPSVTFDTTDPSGPPECREPADDACPPDASCDATLPAKASFGTLADEQDLMIDIGHRSGWVAGAVIGMQACPLSTLAARLPCAAIGAVAFSTGAEALTRQAFGLPPSGALPGTRTSAHHAINWATGALAGGTVVGGACLLLAPPLMPTCVQVGAMAGGAIAERLTQERLHEPHDPFAMLVKAGLGLLAASAW